MYNGEYRFISVVQDSARAALGYVIIVLVLYLHQWDWESPAAGENGELFVFYWFEMKECVFAVARVWTLWCFVCYL